MSVNLSRTYKVDAVQAITTTTANSTIYSDYVDTANFDGCVFTALFKSTAGSTGTAAFSVVGATSSTTPAASYATITGASVTVTASTAANAKRVASIEIARPQTRYLRALINKKNKLIVGGVIAQKYRERVEPAAASTTYAGASAALSKVLVVPQTT